MKFKVGDRVRVINNPVPPTHDYGGYYMTKRMCALAGQVLTITEVLKDCYRVEGSQYGWTDAMFSGLEEE